MNDAEAASWPRRHDRAYLAAGLAVLFVALGQGRLTDVDADARRLITRQLWMHGTVFVDADHPNRLLIRTPGGKTSYFGLGQSVVFVPFDMVAWGLGRAFDRGGELGRQAEELPYAFLYCPLAGLAWWWSSAALGAAMGLSRRDAYLGSTLLCTSTVALHYLAQTQNEEPIVGTIVNLALIHALRWAGPGPGSRNAFWSGMWAGTSILFRINAVFACSLILGVVADGIWGRRVGGRRLVAGVAAFLAGVAVPLLILLATNAWRFGDPLQTGYKFQVEQLRLAGHPDPVQAMRPGVALGLLFGPGKGLFTTSPALFLGLGGLVLLGRRRPFLCSGIVAAFAISALFYSKLGVFPDGSVSWGSRYHGHLIGLMVCPTMMAIHALWRGAAGRALAVGIIVLSLVIQLLSLLGPDPLEYQQADPDDRGFPLITGLGRGQLGLRASNVARWVSGSPNPPPRADTRGEFELFREEIPNFWGPTYARKLGRPAAKAAILVIWSANLLLGLGMVVHALGIRPGGDRGGGP